MKIRIRTLHIGAAEFKWTAELCPPRCARVRVWGGGKNGCMLRADLTSVEGAGLWGDDPDAAYGVRAFQAEGLSLSLSAVAYRSTLAALPYTCQIADVLDTGKVKLIMPLRKGSNALDLAEDRLLLLTRCKNDRGVFPRRGTAGRCRDRSGRHHRSRDSRGTSAPVISATVTAVPSPWS